MPKVTDFKKKYNSVIKDLPTKNLNEDEIRSLGHELDIIGNAQSISVVRNSYVKIGGIDKELQEQVIKNTVIIPEKEVIPKIVESKNNDMTNSKQVMENCQPLNKAKNLTEFDKASVIITQKGNEYEKEVVSTAKVTTSKEADKFQDLMKYYNSSIAPFLNKLNPLPRLKRFGKEITRRDK